jgi:hypothetical protein
MIGKFFSRVIKELTPADTTTVTFNSSGTYNPRYGKQKVYVSGRGGTGASYPSSVPGQDVAASGTGVYNQGSQNLANTYNQGSQNLANTYNQGSQNLANTYNQGSQNLANTYNQGSQNLANTYNQGSQGLANTYNQGSQNLANTYNQGSQNLANTYNQGSQNLTGGLNTNNVAGSSTVYNGTTPGTFYPSNSWWMYYSEYYSTANSSTNYGGGYGNSTTLPSPVDDWDYDVNNDAARYLQNYFSLEELPSGYNAPTPGGNPSGSYNTNYNSRNPAYNSTYSGTNQQYNAAYSGTNQQYNAAYSGTNQQYNAAYLGNTQQYNAAYTNSATNYPASYTGASTSLFGVTLPGGTYGVALDTPDTLATSVPAYSTTPISITVPTGGYVTIKFTR